MCCCDERADGIPDSDAYRLSHSQPYCVSHSYAHHLPHQPRPLSTAPAAADDIDIDGVAYGFMASQALFTGIELGIFDKIAETDGAGLSLSALQAAVAQSGRSSVPKPPGQFRIPKTTPGSLSAARSSAAANGSSPRPVVTNMSLPLSTPCASAAPGAERLHCVPVLAAAPSL